MSNDPIPINDHLPHMEKLTIFNFSDQCLCGRQWLPSNLSSSTDFWLLAQMKTHRDIEWIQFFTLTKPTLIHIRSFPHLQVDPKVYELLGVVSWGQGPCKDTFTVFGNVPCKNFYSPCNFCNCFENQLFRLAQLDCERSRRSVLFQSLMTPLSTFPKKWDLLILFDSFSDGFRNIYWQIQTV